MLQTQKTPQMYQALKTKLKPIGIDGFVKQCQYVWVTKTGERIPIKEMSDRHLLNSINFFESKDASIENCEDRLHALRCELRRRTPQIINRRVEL